MELEELRRKREALKAGSDKTLRGMEAIAGESERVAGVAHRSREILDDLDQEFECQTGLKGRDIPFLFTAVGLQAARIVLLQELTKQELAGSTNRNETKLHELQQKILGKFSMGELMQERPYYASMEHIVTKTGVPYDATAPLDQKAIDKLTGKGASWDFDLGDVAIPDGEKLSLFKGANHRFATLGHDPILGLLFGTGNIMTNTITCVKKPLAAVGIGIPILTTNHVVFTSDFKHPKIAVYASTFVMLQRVLERTQDQPSALVASLIKQIIHIGTDLYTPCGIQIPGANLILTNTNVETLTKYIGAGDLIKAGVSAKLATFINFLISAVHTLMYDPAGAISRKHYNVRTRKIIMYSNAIATGSNVLWVGGNMLAGNEGAVKQLDIGGLMVTLHRLSSDSRFIRELKEEFVLGGFRDMIRGDGFEWEEPIWD